MADLIPISHKVCKACDYCGGCEEVRPGRRPKPARPEASP